MTPNKLEVSTDDSICPLKSFGVTDFLDRVFRGDFATIWRTMTGGFIRFFVLALLTFADFLDPFQGVTGLGERIDEVQNLMMFPLVGRISLRRCVSALPGRDSDRFTPKPRGKWAWCVWAVGEARESAG
jgi:hypothetical protein